MRFAVKSYYAAGLLTKTIRNWNNFLKMIFNLVHFKRFDWTLVMCVALITAFGLAGIWSAGLAKEDFSNFYKQIAFVTVGFFLMALISFFDYRILRNNPYLILALYFLCLALLAGLFFLAPEVRGTNRWYKLGPLSFDPIELSKIILVVLLAKYFSMRHVEMYKLRHILISGFYVFLMAILVFLRPNLGGAIILVLIWAGILMVSGIKLKHFLILSFCSILLAGFSFQFLLRDYQKERITAFLLPYDVLGSSWSQSQAKITIGSGQIFGEGLGKGSQVQYGFLPEPHTDFIFSVIAQEWGVLGISAFFILYFVLIRRILKIAVESESNFPRLFSVGFAVILISQFIINIGMNLSLLPVVGIYLPFVSYGGSGLMANFVSLGILQSIKTKK